MNSEKIITPENKNQLPDIPKSKEIYSGDINDAVITVQKITAYEITPEWWEEYVGSDGPTEDILERFDAAFEKFVREQITGLSMDQQEESPDDNEHQALQEADEEYDKFNEQFKDNPEYGTLSQEFLEALRIHLTNKYLNEEVDKVHSYVTPGFHEQLSELPNSLAVATTAYVVSEKSQDGQSFDEYTQERERTFAKLNKGELPDMVEPAGTESDAYSERQALLERYHDFENADVRHDLIASGQDSDVYTYEQDDKQYVIRVVKAERLAENPAKTDDYVTGLLHGKGVQGLEQIVAYSYLDGEVISERASGESLEKLLKSHPEMVTAIPDEHLEDLLEVFERMQERGLVADINRGNLIYDQMRGFTLVDYQWCAPEYWSVRGQSLNIKIQAFTDLENVRFPELKGLTQRFAGLAGGKTERLMAK